ncbi:MAG: ABC transporter substrate-binding protein [Actinomycetes bacterium]
MIPPVRRALGLTALVTSAALTLAACGGSSTDVDTSPTASKSNPANVLKVGISDTVSNLLPGVEAGSTNYWIAAIQAEGLVTLGDDGSLKPALATSWTQPDATTYVYEIDPHRTFQNGKPVTMADILASIDAAKDPKVSPAESYLWGSVAGVEQTGKWEVTIKLSAPDASFQYTPSSSAGLWVYPAAYWRSAGNKVGTAEALPVGTGPYEFTSYEPDSGITLKKSPQWTGHPAAFDEVDFEIIPDNNNEKLALEKGDLDIAMPIPVSQYGTWEDSSRIDTFFTPNRSLFSIDFDTSATPFDDQHVRNAVAYAFDRQAYVDKVLHGHGRVATSLLTPEQLAAAGPVDEATKVLAGLPQYGFDLTKAKAELAQSSVPDGFTTEIQVPSAYPELVTAAQLLAEDLKQIGITLEIKKGPTSDWFGTMGDGKHGIGFMLYSTVSADPGELSLWFLAPGNPAHMSDAGIGKAIRASRTASDPQTRIDDLVEANRIQNEKNFYAPVSWGQIAIASRGVTLDGWSSYTLTTPWVLEVSPK